MNYCKYCGQPLNEQGICTCEEATKERESMLTATPIVEENNNQEAMDNDMTATTATESITIQPNINQEFQQDFEPKTNGSNASTHTSKTTILKTALKNVVPFLKAFVKSPANTINTCAENDDLPLAGLVYGFYIITLMLCEICSISKIMKSFHSVTSLFLGSGQIIKISYLWLILCSLLIGIGIIVITNLVMLLLGLCFHNQYKVKQTIAANCAIFVYPAISFLLAAIFMFISVPLGLVILFIGNITFLFVFFYTMKTLFKKDDNSSFFLISILLVAVLSLLTSFTAVKLTASFASNIVKSNLSYSSIYDDYDDYYNDYDEDYYFDFFN